MTARFILSLDCEGKWGVADHLTANTHQALTDAGLRQAYSSIFALLDRYQIPATFAYVACFSLTQAQLHERRAALAAYARSFPHYLGVALHDAFEGSQQGWAGEWAVDMARACQQPHEIALHGVTHVPWDEPAMTEELARAELALAYDLNMPIAQPGLTYIYPRGGLNYTHLLAERGIVGYRLVRKHESRIKSLLSEFDLTSPPDADPMQTEAPLKIPAGYFINWRHGGRKLVPVEVTRLRARRMLAKAAHENKVVHYWTHPENIASAPETLAVMEAILHEVAVLRERGQCQILTQLDYCRQVLPAAQVA